MQYSVLKPHAGHKVGAVIKLAPNQARYGVLAGKLAPLRPTPKRRRKAASPAP